ncbi:adenylyl-sulfate kinase [Helicobacter sp. 12S02232-10]|uniref:adenylyl-sulfate kinase n=1 Tax=Helicobacter sp. 12S02232-10 TaxID=1476197 RepID=UPI000BA58ED6|nr:adenylyl-sulfate kinase [Helicobacter sp. 12S02232-10]PAF48846.1 adenylyl-sulfate kinase [Helicobacter sp. 12S02232-10]
MKHGLIIWINGLAGSGKSTIGKNLYDKLKPTFSNLVYLDGDGFRELFGHFKHDKQSRIKVALKRADLCHFLASQGINVIATTISLFEEIYQYNRKKFNSYLEIYIQCDLDELIKRDQKNLYSQAIQKQIKNVVGIDIPYDTPSPDMIINNNRLDNLEEKTNQILHFIKEHQILPVKFL